MAKAKKTVGKDAPGAAADAFADADEKAEAGRVADGAGDAVDETRDARETARRMFLAGETCAGRGRV